MFCQTSAKEAMLVDAQMVEVQVVLTMCDPKFVHKAHTANYLLCQCHSVSFHQHLERHQLESKAHC